MVAQFQYKSSGYNYALTLVLEQNGDDIYGYVQGIRYGLTLGDNMSSITIPTTGNTQYFLDEAEQDAFKSSGTFSISAKNLRLSFYQVGQEFTVQFMDADETTLLKEVTVVSGEGVAEEDIPTPTTQAGYICYGWNDNIACVRDNLVVSPLFHKLYNVTFLDADGSQLGEVQSIEEAKAAVAPDMTGKTSADGGSFKGWDTAFSSVTEDLTVRTLYNSVFTVSFKDADGSAIGENVRVEEGDTVTPPSAISRTKQFRPPRATTRAFWALPRAASNGRSTTSTTWTA